jgi:adenylate cyclase
MSNTRSPEQADHSADSKVRACQLEFRVNATIIRQASYIDYLATRQRPTSDPTVTNMAMEIERKFLVKGDAWRALAKATTYRQGYLNSAKERTVRVRTAGDKQAFLTVKGLTVGATRAEYEYEIPFDEGKAMLDTLAEKPLIEKKRYKIPVGGLTWELDEFLGDNAGLIVAEVELKSEDQAFDRPSWLGEVTGDPRYYNANLIKKPFTRWQ